MNNNQVINAWVQGREARGANLWTDGQDLFSYDLMIGFTSKLDGKRVVFGYTAPGNFICRATSYHVGLAKDVAYMVVEPYPDRPTDSIAKAGQIVKKVLG